MLIKTPMRMTKKTIQKSSRLKAAIVLLLLMFLAASYAAAGVVTKTADTNDGVCDSDCSLREAIATAPAGDTITFSALFNTPRTINLTLGQLLINKNLTIQGTGARRLTVQRSAAAGTPNFRVFQIFGANTVVNISGMTIANGNVPGEEGAGILNAGNTLNLDSVWIRDNSAGWGGGGFAHSSSSSSTNITNSTISGNRAISSDPADHQANGGGLMITGRVKIANTTISNNQSTNFGGGISVSSGVLELNNVTVSHNQAPIGGGLNCFCSASNPGTNTVRNSIIAQNTASTLGPDVYGSVTSNGNNLVGLLDGNGGGFTNGVNGDRVGTTAAPLNPLLGALQNNGGETDTRMLLIGSPALGAGNDCVTNLTCPTNNPPSALANDQRGVGFTRRFAGAVDMGAFEAGTTVVLNNNDSGAGSLRQAIADSVGNGDILFQIPPNVAGCDSFGVCTITLTTGELAVNKNLDITGTGARTTVIRRSAAAGTPNFRVFNVASTGTILKLRSLTVTGGNSAQNGGGIQVVAGATLDLTEVAVTNNTGSLGGGIMNSGDLFVTRSLIGYNHGTNDSGAIRNNGTALIVNSTLSNNRSNNNGGAILDFGTLTLINSTVSANQGNVGAGIWKASGGASSLRNTIVAANISGNGDPRLDITGTFTSLGNNLIGNNNGAAASFPAGRPNANGDLVGTPAAPVNPLLGALASNGGGTDTHLPLLGSPAVDAGNNCVVNSTCPTADLPAGLANDQRGGGLARQVGAAVDIGAVEQRVESVANTADGGAGSLRQMIINTPPGSIINFNYSASTPGCAGGVCTITLTSGALAVDKALTLNGPGARSLIIRRSTAAGTPIFRVFNITGNIAVNLSGLTVANGNGGIFVNGSLLNLNGVAIRDNHAIAGAGIYSLGTVNIINSAVYNNASQASGLPSEASPLGVFGGGGIYNAQTLNVANSTISSNESSFGGGILNDGSATLNNVTISHNRATGGGGIFGGGTVRNTIIAQNTATSSGSHDISGAFTSLGNNLIGNNTNSAGFTNGVNGDIVGSAAAPVNPLFGALQNNGGTTDTRALLPNSPAINKGNNCVRNLSCAAGNPLVAITTDQRGATFPRMIGTTVDIGAYEMFSTRRAPFDFDGDNKTDIGVWRASSGSWWYLHSSDLSGHGHSFGLGSDIITPGDYTGDGKADVAIFRPSTAFWYIQRSEDASYTAVPFGLPGDIPAPADYDGDGITDLGVYRPSNQTWFIQQSGGNFGILTFGLDGDRPVPADYDGDGKADIAVWRSSNATWWIVRSSDFSSRGYGFGSGTDRPVVGDYTGDGKADIAVWRDATREWYFLRSEDESYYSYPSGLPGDLPAAGDYDGDGEWDSAVFRPSTQTWYIDGSSAGTMIATFGLSGDRPVANAFVP